MTRGGGGASLGKLKYFGEKLFSVKSFNFAGNKFQRMPAVLSHTLQFLCNSYQFKIGRIGKLYMVQNLYIMITYRS